MKVIAIDDEPLALRQMAAYIKKIPFFELVGEFQSALDAKKFLEQDTADAMFCDISMPDLNGLDFIRQMAVPPLVVLTTAYSEYAIEGFKIEAVDYLLKPFGLDDVRRAANKLKRQYDLLMGYNNAQALQSQTAAAETSETAAATLDGDDDTIFIKTDYKIVRVGIKDIRYIEGMSEYLRIFVEGEPKPYVVLLSMKKLEERLPSYFMRIHRSYIINLKKIQEVNKNRVIMDKDTYLPIGDMYKDAFSAYINTKFIGR